MYLTGFYDRPCSFRGAIGTTIARRRKSVMKLGTVGRKAHQHARLGVPPSEYCRLGEAARCRFRV